ncbi:tumor necrosis factor ligand superfamily member 13 isoform X2 [Chanos chanos]|uniref:Tumor necrosis factor ligand superfamily member 13 isoform X2 n=1 Tax=Chanos chanos TaxID=29144 RepID=A0A6J2WVB2_CHACN|nr:tumor necrosis factor ligand superfamily member 13-like isoform X2 [Chanos chanos]
MVDCTCGRGDGHGKVRNFLLCAAAVAVACTCLSVLCVQLIHINNLRIEMTELKQRVQSLNGREGATSIAACCETTACCGVWSCERPCHKEVDGESRGRREVLARERKRKRRQTEPHTFLHLVPVSPIPLDESDSTVLTWALGWGQGEGLQASGRTVTVVTEGTYFIYSQVLYKDSTWVMGHVIVKRFKGSEVKLMKCLKSMPSNASLALNTCYTAGVHFLESGSVLELYIPRKSAELVLSAHATFLGIFRV